MTDETAHNYHNPKGLPCDAGVTARRACANGSIEPEFLLMPGGPRIVQGQAMLADRARSRAARRASTPQQEIDSLDD